MDTARSIRDWVRRNKKKLLVSAGAVGVGYVCYLAIKVYHGRVGSEQNKAHVHASLLRQTGLRAEPQLQSHFEDIQRISDATTLPSILIHLKRQLSDQLDISGLTEKLAQGKESLHQAPLSGQEKLELWEELKLRSFTYTTCSMLGLTLLVLCVRVELNILGRHVYLDAARDISSVELGEQKRPTYQQTYIAFSEFLPERGLLKLIPDTKAAVQEVVGSMPFKEVCRIADIRGIFDTIFKKFVNGETNWLKYMLPPDNMLSHNAGASATNELAGHSALSFDDKQKVENLLSETREILDSKEFKEVLLSSCDLVLNEALVELDIMCQERSTISAPLAKLLPLVTKMGSMLIDGPFEQKFVALLTSQQQLNSFCATVYATGGEQ